MHAVRLAVAENPSPDWLREVDYEAFFGDRGRAWVAESSGRILGFAAVDLGTQSLWALFVDPRAERQGVGRALHDRLLAWCADRGIDRLSLSTMPGTRAEHFYERAGWQRVAITACGEVRLERCLGTLERVKGIEPSS